MSLFNMCPASEAVSLLPKAETTTYPHYHTCRGLSHLDRHTHGDIISGLALWPWN